MPVALYDLVKQYADLAAFEIESEEDLAAFQELAHGLDGTVEEKVLNIAKVIKSLEAEAEAIRNEEKRLAARRQTRENKIGHLKQYAESCLTAAGLDRVKDEFITVAYQKNPPAVEVFDQTSIPEKYWIQQEPRLDKKGIADAMKAGEIVPGVAFRNGASLRIR